MKTRCKFYVSSVNLSAYSSGGSNDTSHCQVTLNACYSKDEGSENNSFWKATPNGSMKLSGSIEALAKFTNGSYWYFDWEPSPHSFDALEYEESSNALYHVLKDEESLWRLCEVAYPYMSQQRVKLERPNGVFEISIDNKKAWFKHEDINRLFRLTQTPTEK